jgi:hypothetical protein
MSPPSALMRQDIDIEKPVQSHVEELRSHQTTTEIDPQLDKRLNKKLDRHIMPWLFGIWCVRC